MQEPADETQLNNLQDLVRLLRRMPQAYPRAADRIEKIARGDFGTEPGPFIWLQGLAPRPIRPGAGAAALTAAATAERVVG